MLLILSKSVGFSLSDTKDAYKNTGSRTRTAEIISDPNPTIIP